MLLESKVVFHTKVTFLNVLEIQTVIKFHSLMPGTELGHFDILVMYF